jgi:hypothetical protein
VSWLRRSSRQADPVHIHEWYRAVAACSRRRPPRWFLGTPSSSRGIGLRAGETGP